MWAAIRSFFAVTTWHGCMPLSIKREALNHEKTCRDMPGVHIMCPVSYHTVLNAAHPLHHTGAQDMKNKFGWACHPLEKKIHTVLHTHTQTLLSMIPCEAWSHQVIFTVVFTCLQGKEEEEGNRGLCNLTRRNSSHCLPPDPGEVLPFCL